MVSLILSGWVSVFEGLGGGKVGIGGVKDVFERMLAVYEVGIGWIVRGILGMVIGFVMCVLTCCG